MRAVALAVFLASCVALVFLVSWVVDRMDRRTKALADRRTLAAPGDEEARRYALEAVRLLDRALVDPMYRQSTEWEDQAKALVDGYYGKGLKR